MAGPDAAAIACTLAPNDHERRVQVWQDVTSRTLRGKTATAVGVRLDFAPDHETAHTLLDLVTAERDCCGWATWTFTSTKESSQIEVAAEGAGAATLHTMFEVTP